MTFSKDEEANSYILNLEDCQISFDIIEGEDEEGPWFEVECNIIFLLKEDNKMELINFN